jgi:hypothetical protein
MLRRGEARRGTPRMVTTILTVFWKTTNCHISKHASKCKFGGVIAVYSQLNYGLSASRIKSNHLFI